MKPEDVEKAVKSLDSPEEEEEAVSQFLSEIASTRTPNTAEQTPLCLGEKAFLDNLRHGKTISIDSIRKLEVLDPQKDSAAQPGKIKYIVYEGPRFNPEKSDVDHMKAVTGVIKKLDPSADDSQIMTIGAITKAKERDPDSWIKLPSDHNFTDRQRKTYEDNISFGKQVIEDLQKLLPIVKENPNAVINMSFRSFDLYLDHPEARSKSRAETLSTNDLHLAALPSLDKFNKATAETIKAHLEARQDDRDDIKTMLGVVGALNDLADQGAQIRIAWGNSDKISLTHLIAQLHPNIKAVAASDWEGKPIEYNDQTAQLARAEASGTIILLPDSVSSKVKESQVKNATILSDTTLFSDRADLSGKELAPLKIGAKDLAKLKQMVEVSLLLNPDLDTVNLAEEISGSKINRKDAEKEADILYRAFEKKFGAKEARIKLGDKSEFISQTGVIMEKAIVARKMLEQGEDLTPALKTFFENAKEFQNAYERADVEVNLMTKLEKLGYKRDKSEPDILKDIERIRAKLDLDFNGFIADKVLSRGDLKYVFGERSENLLNNPNQGRGNFFRLNHANLLKDGSVETYWSVKAGNKVILAREIHGTSFASPYEAGIAAKKALQK